MHVPSPGWYERAACRSHDPDLFFPIGRGETALDAVDEAKAVCRTCMVSAACLRWAVGFGEPHGIWGGTTPEERRRLRLGWTDGRVRRGA